MKYVIGLSGKSLDPAVVEVLGRRYRELEQMAQAQPLPETRLSRNLKVARGDEPDAGFEVSQASGHQECDFLYSIAAARQEVQLLFELTQDLGTSLSLDETLSVVAIRLKKMVPYDAIAVYIARDKELIPHYVHGENFRLFSSLQIPIGEGLSGWVAENLRDPGYHTALGLLYYGINAQTERTAASRRSGGFLRSVTRLFVPA